MEGGLEFVSAQEAMEGSNYAVVCEALHYDQRASAGRVNRG